MNYNNDRVRRQDRLLEQNQALDLLRLGEYGVLSMVEECADKELGGYGIPLNYVWDGENSVYFHCSPEGHKLNCISLNPKVSFCVVGHTDVISQKFTTAYESIVLRGEVFMNLQAEERMLALSLLLHKYSPNDKEKGMEYAKNSFNRTNIIKLDIKEFSGKSKRIKG